MLDEVQAEAEIEADYVRLLRAGAPANGVYQCADCGYGVSVQASLPQCPMCSGTAWELVPGVRRPLETATAPPG